MGTLINIILFAVSVVYVWNNYRESSGAVQTFPSDVQCMLAKPWASKTLLEKSYSVVFVLFILAILPWPYEYYHSLRFGVCVCLYFYFAEAKKQKQVDAAWPYAFAALGVLYNPLFPIHLGVQAVWTIINVATLLFLYRARLVIDRPADPPVGSGTK